jgi:hypothetical protein
MRGRGAESLAPKRDRDGRFRAVLAVVGAVLLVTGAAAVFATDNEVGTAALLATGAALAALAYGGERVTRFSAGGVELELARASALEEAATVAEARGEPALAEELRSRALRSLREVAGRYDEVRQSLPSGAERTRRMERILSDTRKQARTTTPTAADIRALFDGDDGDRIAALGAMYEHAELRDFELLIDALERSRSAFEQYHTLRLMEDLVANLDETQQTRLKQALLAQHEQPGRIGPRSDRRAISERLLRKLG